MYIVTKVFSLDEASLLLVSFCPKEKLAIREENGQGSTTYAVCTTHQGASSHTKYDVATVRFPSVWFKKSFLTVK